MWSVAQDSSVSSKMHHISNIFVLCSVFRIAPEVFGKTKDTFWLICIFFKELNKKMLQNFLGQCHLWQLWDFLKLVQKCASLRRIWVNISLWIRCVYVLLSAAVHVTGVKSLCKSLWAWFCFLLACELNKTMSILRRYDANNGNRGSKQCKKDKL